MILRAWQLFALLHTTNHIKRKCNYQIFVKKNYVLGGPGAGKGLIIFIVNRGRRAVSWSKCVMSLSESLSLSSAFPLRLCLSTIIVTQVLPCARVTVARIALCELSLTCLNCPSVASCDVSPSHVTCHEEPGAPSHERVISAAHTQMWREQIVTFKIV